MDLGIKGKNALICASSRGLGKGCAKALATEGVNVWLNGRDEDTLNAAAQEIRKVAQGDVTAIACDITTEDGRNLALSQTPDLDILVNNAGGPPVGDFRQWGLQDWHSALNNNMLAPIDLFNRVLDGMIERGFGRIVNITSSSVKAPVQNLDLSNGARSGLTGFFAGASRQVAPFNVTVNSILPGRFDTDRLRSSMRPASEKSGKTIDQMLEVGKAQIPSGRYGSSDEFGALCAFLCSVHAGYITGQNILIDGGLVALNL
ncbi:MAG: SDR family oxidoreductase [Acidiferrobacterales bacterium]|nr:SDR family oxidoreductase [Acidiferrobacterales bacterium]